MLSKRPLRAHLVFGSRFEPETAPKTGGYFLGVGVFFGLWNLPGARLLLERSWTSIFNNFGSVLKAKNMVWGLWNRPFHTTCRPQTTSETHPRTSSLILDFAVSSTSLPQLNLKQGRRRCLAARRLGLAPHPTKLLPATYAREAAAQTTSKSLHSHEQLPKYHT